MGRRQKHLDDGYPLVEIDWEDARFFEGWSPVDGDPAAARTALCRSWGVLVKETEQHLTIAQTLSTEGMKADLLTLPRRMIRKMSVLKYVEELE